MRTWITIICLGALAGCFEEETEKPVLGTQPSPRPVGDGGVDCYDPSLCSPGFELDGSVGECFFDEAGFLVCPAPDDAGVPECFVDDGGFSTCPAPEDAGFPDCFLDEEGFTVCPAPDDAGVPECFVDEAGLVHCPAPADAGEPACFESDGRPCGETPDAGFDPYA